METNICVTNNVGTEIGNIGNIFKMNLEENYVFGVCNDTKADNNEVEDDYDNAYKVIWFYDKHGVIQVITQEEVPSDSTNMDKCFMRLLLITCEADINEDGLVNRRSFLKLIDIDASITSDGESYKTPEFKALIKSALFIESTANNEMYCFLVELFTESSLMDGIMMLSKFLEPPRRPMHPKENTVN